MGHRLPTILGKAIDDVVVTLNEESAEERIVDLVACIERMEELKVELEQHAKIRPIVDDGEADVALWNKEIAKYFLGGSDAGCASAMSLIQHDSRQGFHERYVAFRGGIQVSPPTRVLQCQ